MTQKISLTSQMAAVQAAADGRSFQSRSAAEDLQRRHLQAALATLRWVKSHEEDIRAFVTIRQGGKP